MLLENGCPLITTSIKICLSIAAEIALRTNGLFIGGNWVLNPYNSVQKLGTDPHILTQSGVRFYTWDLILW
ncbi:hypothetical protein BGP_4654 [Beggiatoa sp. PS]|nr:hypothetical protein BGP_4654 [Beggiatoa sp. PS]